MNRLRLEFAAEAFLVAMRREQAARQPQDPVAIKSLAEYAPADRSALMKAVSAAIQASQAKSDPTFKAWSERRAENA